MLCISSRTSIFNVHFSTLVWIFFPKNPPWFHFSFGHFDWRRNPPATNIEIHWLWNFRIELRFFHLQCWFFIALPHFHSSRIKQSKAHFFSFLRFFALHFGPHSSIYSRPFAPVAKCRKREIKREQIKHIMIWSLL